MTHWAAFGGWSLICIYINLLDTGVLLIPPRTCSWFGIAIIWLLRSSSAIPILYGGERSGTLSMIANLLFMGFLLFGGPDGMGKKLWGKLRSSALTAVNAASFRNQTRQALS